jgi:hypothetical protein
LKISYQIVALDKVAVFESRVVQDVTTALVRANKLKHGDVFNATPV